MSRMSTGSLGVHGTLRLKVDVGVRQTDAWRHQLVTGRQQLVGSHSADLAGILRVRDGIWWGHHRVGNVGRGIVHVGPDLHRVRWGELAVGDVDDLADVDPVAGVFAVRRVLGRWLLGCSPGPEPEGLGVTMATRWCSSCVRPTTPPTRGASSIQGGRGRVPGAV